VRQGRRNNKHKMVVARDIYKKKRGEKIKKNCGRGKKKREYRDGDFFSFFCSVIIWSLLCEHRDRV